MAERQFGPYRLVKQIAVGGMAEIHLAKTRGIAGFEKFCALKMIHPNFAQDEQFIEMLIDEAKIAVQLQHVNIAQTFDLGRVGDTYYITMEFVDGADLYKILRRGSEQDLDMPVDVAAFVAKEMATGLDYAHRKKDGSGHTLGIVHRDVSPQNVLLSHAGEVKLVDFGIAKATMKARQTAVGVIKGKYYYMSPEQAWGERLDYRSDIFSAGIVLYEMLTGQMLYLEEDLHSLLDMVRRADIEPVRNLRGDVPPQLERIVMHALAKKPDDRYQSAGDLASDLERFLHAYSPVFTASKLAQHLRRVLGESEPPGRRAPAPRDPLQSTQSISQHTYITDRSEISDENSVIFRVGDLKPDPPEPRHPGRPRMISAATMEITDEDLGADVEHTLVTSGPPPGGVSEDTTALEGPRGVRRGARDDHATDVGDDLGGLGDYEPTVIDEVPSLMPSGQHEEDQPTITRGPGVPRLASEERSTARGRRPPMPAALSANTPTPAVSEVRRRRESRRTPAGGVPQASVLQSLVGGPSEPMPRPARGAGAPLSDGVPAAVRESGPTHVPTSPVGGRGGVPRPPSAALEGLSAGPLDPAFDAPTSPGTVPAPAAPAQAPAVPPGPGPDMAALPAHLTPYAMPPAAQTVSPYPPGAVPTPYPFHLQPGGPPMSFTKQIQAATEIDEMPAHYRLPSNRGWMVRAFLALVVVTAGIIAAVAIVRSGSDVEVEASLLIESTPPGAEVAIDGDVLSEKTPTRFATRPGARHEIAMTMPGRQPYRDAVLIPDQGGQLRVFAFLPEVTVKLKVVTTPPGADVYLGGQLKGRTPIELTDLSPEAARELEVRHKDFPPVSRTLVWPEGQLEQEVAIKLRK